MQFIEVKDKRTARTFRDVARIIYRGDRNWVCPLDSAIEAVFNPQKNVFFRHGEAIRWVLLDDIGRPVGRVAAFINKAKAYTYQQPTGGMGFFECTKDKEAAFMLFDKCREWLTERGMKAMDGPINFGENDNFWGLLVEGFMPPGIGMNFNPPYYREFFESYGFKFYYEQISNHLDLTKPFPERFWRIAERVMQTPGFTYRHFTFEEADKLIGDMKLVYDEAWRFHENFTPINKDDLLRALARLRPILEEKFNWFVYHEDKPIAFLIMLPDVNQILKHLNGKLHLLNKLRFLYYKSRKEITRARIVIMGVVPQYQRRGIESGIFWHMKQVMDKMPHYTELELSWVGDFNPKMRMLHESVGAVFAKRHITYRMIFDDDLAFTRSTIIPRDTKEKAAKGLL